MRREDLIRFARRDWDEVERRLEAEDRGPAEGVPAARRFEIASGLFRSVRRLRPDWPSDAEREADLAAHRSLSDRLSRVVPRPAR